MVEDADFRRRHSNGSHKSLESAGDFAQRPYTKQVVEPMKAPDAPKLSFRGAIDFCVHCSKFCGLGSFCCQSDVDEGRLEAGEFALGFELFCHGRMFGY